MYSGFDGGCNRQRPSYCGPADGQTTAGASTKQQGVQPSTFQTAFQGVQPSTFQTGKLIKSYNL